MKTKYEALLNERCCVARLPGTRHVWIVVAAEAPARLLEVLCESALRDMDEGSPPATQE